MTHNSALLKLATHIRDTRVARNLTQAQLANKIGIDQKFVHSIETGEVDLTILDIIAIAKALEISLKDLFTGIE